MRFETYYIVNEDGAILEEVETNFYDEALSWRDTMADDLGVTPESLEVMTAEEYEEEWGN